MAQASGSNAFTAAVLAASCVSMPGHVSPGIQPGPLLTRTQAHRQRSTIRGSCTDVTGCFESEETPQINSHHKTTVHRTLSLQLLFTSAAALVHIHPVGSRFGGHRKRGSKQSAGAQRTSRLKPGRPLRHTGCEPCQRTRRTRSRTPSRTSRLPCGYVYRRRTQLRRQQRHRWSA